MAAVDEKLAWAWVPRRNRTDEFDAHRTKAMEFHHHNQPHRLPHTLPPLLVEHYERLVQVYEDMQRLNARRSANTVQQPEYEQTMANYVKEQKRLKKLMQDTPAPRSIKLGVFANAARHFAPVQAATAHHMREDDSVNEQRVEQVLRSADQKHQLSVAECAQLLHSVTTTHQMMNDMATMVVEQDLLLDAIDHHVDEVVVHVDDGTEELQQAVVYKEKCNLARTITLVLLLLNGVAALVLVVMHTA